MTPPHSGQPADTPVPGAEPGPFPLDLPLPSLSTPLAPEAIADRLDAAARRGRLPGFVRAPSGPELFSADAFGTPYDGRLVASAEGQGPTTLRFRSRLLPKMPAIFAVALILAVWPGVTLTESMLATVLPGWGWLWRSTPYWYLPLTVPFVPWLMWTTTRRSRIAIHDSAHRQIRAIAKELDVPIPASAPPSAANAMPPGT